MEESQASSRALTLSCVACRRRKVKCDKLDPCTPCTKASVECVFLKRKRRRNPLTARQDVLLGRLAKLEAMVAQADPSSARLAEASGATGAVFGRGPRVVSGELAELGGLAGLGGSWPSVPPFHQEGAPGGGGADTSDPTWPSPGITISNGRAGGGGVAAAAAAAAGAAAAAVAGNPSGAGSRFISADFWTNLCGEVEGLKQALEQASDDSEGSDPEEDVTQPPGMVPTRAILGNPGSSVPEGLLDLPSPQHSSILFCAYFSNFDPMVKILHRPTFSEIVVPLVVGPNRPSEPIDPVTLALVFAVFLGAVTSMSGPDCVSQLGEQKGALIRRFRIATESALAIADFLNSSRLESLQAFTIYVACLRCHSGSRASWVLLSMAIRLAHALGLHRDGIGGKYSPFVTEMRRRLWWQLIVLDIRGAEDRGSEAASPDSYDTAMLTNINDEDFGPATTEPLSDRDGPTDVTFSRCTAMCSRAFLHLRSTTGFTFPKTDEDAFVEHVRHLESLYIDKADPSNPVSALAARILRLTILKLWLSVQYPFQVRQAVTKPVVSREVMLRTAISIIELSEASEAHPGGERFVWWTQTYVQWHPLAVALAELCHQTQGELADRAWTVVDRVFPAWSEKIADTKRGMLWRPIKRLLKKARSARDKARTGDGVGDRETAGRGRSRGQSAVQLGGHPEHDPPQSQFPAPQSSVEPVETETSGSRPPWASFGFGMPSNFFFGSQSFGSFDPGIGDITQDLEVDFSTPSWTDWNEFVADANYTDDISEAHMMAW